MKSLLASRIRPIYISSTRQVKNRVLEHQKIFQADNDLPVHLKGGTMDALLYRFTMALTAIGTAYSIYSLFRAAQPRKN